MLCVLIWYINGGTYSLKSTPNDRFFEKLFMATTHQFTTHLKSKTDLLRQTFNDILIGWNCDVNWPTGSGDLILLGYDYDSKPETIKHLKANIPDGAQKLVRLDEILCQTRFSFIAYLNIYISHPIFFKHHSPNCEIKLK